MAQLNSNALPCIVCLIKNSLIVEKFVYSNYFKRQKGLFLSFFLFEVMGNGKSFHNSNSQSLVTQRITPEHQSISGTITGFSQNLEKSLPRKPYIHLKGMPPARLVQRKKNWGGWGVARRFSAAKNGAG